MSHNEVSKVNVSLIKFNGKAKFSLLAHKQLQLRNITTEEQWGKLQIFLPLCTLLLALHKASSSPQITKVKVQVRSSLFQVKPQGEQKEKMRGRFCLLGPILIFNRRLG